MPDITVVEGHVMQPIHPWRLAFRTLPHTGRACNTQRRNGGPLNYADPSNKS
jgi:hypothetical protein